MTTPDPTTVERATCTAPRHGDPTAYSWHRCRCPEAREAFRLYRKRMREGRQPAAVIDATGTARRLQAFVADGYSFVDLERHLGINRDQIRSIAWRRQPGVRRRTAVRVRQVYDQLESQPGSSKYARTVARRHGWVPPAAWDDDTIDDPTALPNVGQIDTDYVDEVAVLRTLRGERLPLTDAERVAAAAAMRRRGDSATAISRALRCSSYDVAKLVGQAARQAERPAA